MRARRSLVLGAVLAGWALLAAAPARAQSKPIVTALPQSPTAVHVGWTAPPGATEFKVQRAPGTSGPWVPVTQKISALQYLDADVQAATTYGYRVRAWWPDGENTASEPVFVTTPAATAPGGGGSGGVISPEKVVGRLLAPAPAPSRISPGMVVATPISPAGSAGAALPTASMIAAVSPDLTCEIQASDTGTPGDWNLSHVAENSIAGSKLWVRLVAKNGGGAAALDVQPAFNVRINGSPLLILSTGPPVLLDLSPGAKVPGSPAGFSLPSAWNTVEVDGTIDFHNTVAESNEMNNACEKTFVVHAAP